MIKAGEKFTRDGRTFTFKKDVDSTFEALQEADLNLLHSVGVVDITEDMITYSIKNPTSRVFLLTISDPQEGTILLHNRLTFDFETPLSKIEADFENIVKASLRQLGKTFSSFAKEHIKSDIVNTLIEGELDFSAVFNNLFKIEFTEVVSGEQCGRRIAEILARSSKELLN